MQVTEVTAKTDEEYASIVVGRRRGLFQSKELRDRVCVVLKQHGHSPLKSTVSGQNLHPEYVTDYVGTLETGFGNTQYQTYWSKLYTITL